MGNFGSILPKLLGPAAAALTTAWNPAIGLPTLMAIGGLGSVVGEGISGMMGKKREEGAAESAQQAWARMSKPSSEAVSAAATENRGALAQGRLGAYSNLMSNLAARGFGSGSGLMARGAGNIERGYLQGLGESTQKLTQWANTPMFGPPSAAYAKSVPGGLESAFGKSSNLLDSAMGLFSILNLGKGGDTGSYGPSASWNPMLGRYQYY